MSDNRDSQGRFIDGNDSSKGHGRPQGSRSIAGILRKIGDEQVPKELEDKIKNVYGEQIKAGEMTLLEAILRTTMMYAIQGKQWAVQFLADRTEGRPIQTIGITDGNDEPIKVFDFNEVDD